MDEFVQTLITTARFPSTMRQIPANLLMLGASGFSQYLNVLLKPYFSFTERNSCEMGWGQVFCGLVFKSGGHYPDGLWIRGSSSPWSVCSWLSARIPLRSWWNSHAFAQRRHTYNAMPPLDILSSTTPLLNWVIVCFCFLKLVYLALSCVGQSFCALSFTFFNLRYCALETGEPVPADCFRGLWIANLITIS